VVVGLRPRPRYFGAWLLVLGLLALALRWWLLADSGRGSLPIGPDAEDWVIMARSMVAGSTAGLEGNRYPLVPWLAAHAAPLLGGSVPRALALLALACGAASAVVTALLARPLLGNRLAIVAGLWVAATPVLVLAGVSTTAYPLFGLAFLVLVWALLRPPDRPSVALAALASLVLVACLAQGTLCLLALLPAGLLLRRWWGSAAAVAGGGLGLGLVWLLHPSPHSPLGWMLGESWRYLSGNVAEEQAMGGLGYAATWQAWAERALQQPVELILGSILLAVVGLALLGRRPWVTLEARLPPWLVGVAAPLPSRSEVGALAWALLPLVVLLVLMGSAHHLHHLLPLLGVAALLGLRALLPGSGGVPVALVLALGLGVTSYATLPSLRLVLGPRLAEDRGLLLLGERVSAAGAAPVLVTTFGPGEVNPVHRGLWACPLDTRVLGAHDASPEQAAWLDDASAVLLVGPEPSPGVQVGAYRLEPVEAGELLTLDRRRSLWVARAQLR
jgi:hypothetical protein